MYAPQCQTHKKVSLEDLKSIHLDKGFNQMQYEQINGSYNSLLYSVWLCIDR
jgi:hypothetical protein